MQSSTDVSATETNPPGRDFSLENILGENPEDVQHPNGTTQGEATGWDEESTERPLAEGFCIECEGEVPQLVQLGKMLILFPDQPAQIFCETCSDVYCEVCFAAQHRKGSRKLHTTRPAVLERVGKPEKKGSGASGAPSATNDDAVRSCDQVTRKGLIIIVLVDGC